jgi:hypothetical protein
VRTEGAACAARGEVSMLEYYLLLLLLPGETNPSYLGRLSQQVMVGSYTCVMSNRLTSDLLNQGTLQWENYQGISNALGEGNSEGKNIRCSVPPDSSFTGRCRYIMLNYQGGLDL